MQSEESDPSCSSTQDLPDSFKDLRIAQVWRPQSCCQLSGVHYHKSYAQKIRKRRKPVYIRYKPRLQKVQEYKYPMSVHLVENSDCSPEKPCETDFMTFQKREITTIKEESFQINKYIPYKNKSKNHISKSRDFHERVASLKVIVGRLQKMCLEKPEVLENSIPDETIMLFNAIHL